MDQNAINALRQETIAAQSMLIDGKAMPSANGEILEVISPIDGAPLSSIPDATQGDIDRAVGVARRSFETGIWANQPPATRKKVLHKWADLIEANALELAVLGVRDNGTEISMAYKAEPMSAAGTIRYYAEALDKVYGDIAPTAKDVLGLIHTEPVGVVGAIIPWNFPLMIGAWKLGPALATGNSVVLKPAETASLSLIKMAQLAHEAGLPEGVLNVVTGNGATAGQALARSMDVDVLAFTGSGFIGGKLLEYSAQSNLKRVYLELGGKGPHIVFADSNKLDEAAKAVVSGIFRNSGQVCVAGSRLLVEKSIQKDFVAKVAELASHMKLGDPLSIDTQMGRRKFTSEFKFKVVLEALSERYSIQELGRKYDIHPTQITNWKSQFIKNGQSVFDRPVKEVKTESQEKEDRYLKMIGQQKMEIDFLKKASQ